MNTGWSRGLNWSPEGSIDKKRALFRCWQSTLVALSYKAVPISSNESIAPISDWSRDCQQQRTQNRPEPSQPLEHKSNGRRPNVLLTFCIYDHQRAQALVLRKLGNKFLGGCSLKRTIHELTDAVFPNQEVHPAVAKVAVPVEENNMLAQVLAMARAIRSRDGRKLTSSLTVSRTVMGTSGLP